MGVAVSLGGHALLGGDMHIVPILQAAGVVLVVYAAMNLAVWLVVEGVEALCGRY